MISFKSMRFVPLLAAMVAMPALAQMPGYGIPADPVAQLSANLMILSQNPRDVSALLGAGQSAIAVGDGNAALSFLARAEEISPRDGRIKAALGTTLVMLERPGEALRLFAEASALGVSESAIAADRGLAYDLRGDSRRAQRDYQLAQRQGASDEVTRRLALSLGISGDREEALTLIDPLLRKQDQGAWRARAFILAMTGDVSAAEGVARSVMPIGSSDTMTPFLRRLAKLNAAERALAVNFGTMPSDGQRMAMVETGDPFRPAGSGVSGALIPAGEPLGRAADLTPARKSASVSREPRRRPGRDQVAVSGRPEVKPVREEREPPAPPARRAETRIAIASPPPPPLAGRIERRIETRIGPVRSESLPSEVRARLTPLPQAESPAPAANVVSPTPSPVAPPPAAIAPPPAETFVASTGLSRSPPEQVEPLYEVPAPVVSAPVPTVIASVALPPSSVASDAVAGFSLPPGSSSVVVGAGTERAPLAPAIEQPKPEPVALAAPPPAASVPAFPIAPGTTGIAQIIATIEPESESAAAPLPTLAEIRAARLAAQRKADLKGKADSEAKAAKVRKDAEKLAASKHPARVWVQVATGNNEAGLPSTWKKLRDKSPATFKGLSAASVPFRATNRLLVGPLRGQAEARALLGAMQKAGMSGSTYASEAGQEVAKIAAR